MYNRVGAGVPDRPYKTHRDLCYNSDLLKVLMPIMEKLLTELTYKFNDDFSNMPTEKIETIRNVKDILKDLSEVKVLPQSSFDDAVSNVVEYSNNLSVRHCKLKEQILKMAV